ncbi:hypothetical protein BpHYR1_040056 [Brachionus plicatilis]|uniref:Uncharacterized protein n=1 Tax=Brachionus plicatilis TaxID=10195 RepID=A0A3M7RX29_BRAPC|nr:hypothetical protein BpHYR1_040056 [Brachionus plicatilis]
MPFTLERLQKISKSKSLPPRLEEEKRMKLIINETIKKFNWNGHIDVGEESFSGSNSNIKLSNMGLLFMN